MSLAPESTGPAMTWDLSDLYAGPDDPRIAAALDQAVKDAQAFASTYRGTIDVPGGPDPAHLLAALKDFEKILEDTYRVEGYAHLVFDSDTTQPIHRDLMQNLVRIRNTLDRGRGVTIPRYINTFQGRTVPSTSASQEQTLSVVLRR